MGGKEGGGETGEGEKRREGKREGRREGRKESWPLLDIVVRTWDAVGPLMESGFLRTTCPYTSLLFDFHVLETYCVQKQNGP